MRVENCELRNAFPESLAISGAWGYIGRRFLDAALRLGIKVFVHDPGPVPGDLAAGAVTRITDEAAFYRLDADLFHLALHPEQRARALQWLLERGGDAPVLILNEKPMALPETPEACRRILDSVDRSQAVMLYDFPELFDPLTRKIIAHLRRFDDVRITSMYVQRSKDREDPEIPRNHKRMVSIQFQESVHCVAFVVNLLARLRGGLDGVFADGLSVTARAEPYVPPNPRAYPHAVDGRCRYTLRLGEVTVEGLTDFKRGAEPTKRRVIKGVADGRPFTIEADYQEGAKQFVIDGVRQDHDPSTDSYVEVLRTLAKWRERVSPSELMHGLYPNPSFARLTYQLSGVLWRAGYDRGDIRLGSRAELESFVSGYGDTIRAPSSE